MKEETIKNGYIGKIDEENHIVIYCNEKEYKDGFLFKCCKGCKHNLITKE